MNKKAFTFVEIIIVIALISAIVAVAMLTFGDTGKDGQTSILKPSHELYRTK